MLHSEEKMIDIALKYGYDSPDSFTKAFVGFHGVTPTVFQKIHHQIFLEWLPENNYEIVAGYNIEMYSDPQNYPSRVQDSKYYSEIWVPVKKK